MTDRPTNRIGRPSDGWAGGDDALTQRAHQQTPPTSKIRGSNDPAQVSPQAWSQDAGEPGYYRDSSDYYPEAQQPNWHPAPDAYSAPQSDPGELSPKAWFRSAPTYLLAAAAVAVLTAGGGLAYTLTSSDHPAPAHPSVQPAPQQGNAVPVAPQAPPPAQDQPPAPAPDAPISAPDDSSGSAPNVMPAPALAPAPVVAPQPQTDPNPPLPDNQQQPDPNQLPNNQQNPNNQQFPNNQQQPGQHHAPNNQQNQNQQNQNNQNQNPKPNQQNQNQQNQNQNQKQESPNDTLCHPKAPPC